MCNLTPYLHLCNVSPANPIQCNVKLVKEYFLKYLLLNLLKYFYYYYYELRHKVFKVFATRSVKAEE